jgi:hypothetical protein
MQLPLTQPLHLLVPRSQVAPPGQSLACVQSNALQSELPLQVNCPRQPALVQHSAASLQATPPALQEPKSAQPVRAQKRPPHDTDWLPLLWLGRRSACDAPDASF